MYNNSIYSVTSFNNGYAIKNKILYIKKPKIILQPIKGFWASITLQKKMFCLFYWCYKKKSLILVSILKSFISQKLLIDSIGIKSLVLNFCDCKKKNMSKEITFWILLKHVSPFSKETFWAIASSLNSFEPRTNTRKGSR